MVWCSEQNCYGQCSFFLFQRNIEFYFNHGINFVQAYAVMIFSKIKLTQKKEEAEKLVNALQISVTIAKSGTKLLVLPKQLAKN